LGLDDEVLELGQLLGTDGNPRGVFELEKKLDAALAAFAVGGEAQAGFGGDARVKGRHVGNFVGNLVQIIEAAQEMIQFVVIDDQKSVQRAGCQRHGGAV